MKDKGRLWSRYKFHSLLSWDQTHLNVKAALYMWFKRAICAWMKPTSYSASVRDPIWISEFRVRTCVCTLKNRKAYQCQRIGTNSNGSWWNPRFVSEWALRVVGSRPRISIDPSLLRGASCASQIEWCSTVIHTGRWDVMIQWNHYDRRMTWRQPERTGSLANWTEIHQPAPCVHTHTHTAQAAGIDSDRRPLTVITFAQACM